MIKKYKTALITSLLCSNLLVTAYYGINILKQSEQNTTTVNQMAQEITHLTDELLEQRKLNESSIKQLQNERMLQEEHITSLATRIDSYFMRTDYDQEKLKLSYKDIILLAKVMQMEAGEENQLAQRAVGSVILNRINNSKFPNNLHDVIYQKNGAIQFAVAYDGALERCNLKPEVLLTAYDLIQSGSKYPSNLLYFCDDSLDFKWANFYGTIEGTRFYTTK